MHVKADLIKRVVFWYERSYKRGITLIIPYVLSDRWHIFHIKSMLKSYKTMHKQYTLHVIHDTRKYEMITILLFFLLLIITILYSITPTCTMTSDTQLS